MNSKTISSSMLFFFRSNQNNINLKPKNYEKIKFSRA